MVAATQLSLRLHATPRLLTALRGVAYDLISLGQRRLLLGNIGADAGQRLQQFRLLVGRQVDKFAAGVGPDLRRGIVDRDGTLLETRDGAGGVLLDDLLQIGRQRVE